jgi:hypothetical protein
MPPGLSEIIMKAMAVDKTRASRPWTKLRGALERYL